MASNNRILNRSLFVGNNLLQKAQFLGHSIRKMLLSYLGLIDPTDRDSYTNKRVDLDGSILIELYRELWGIFKNKLSLKLTETINKKLA